MKRRLKDYGYQRGSVFSLLLFEFWELCCEGGKRPKQKENDSDLRCLPGRDLLSHLFAVCCCTICHRFVLNPVTIRTKFTNKIKKYRGTYENRASIENNVAWD